MPLGKWQILEHCLLELLSKYPGFEFIFLRRRGLGPFLMLLMMLEISTNNYSGLSVLMSCNPSSATPPSNRQDTELAHGHAAAAT